MLYKRKVSRGCEFRMVPAVAVAVLDVARACNGYIHCTCLDHTLLTMEYARFWWMQACPA